MVVDYWGQAKPMRLSFVLLRVQERLSRRLRLASQTPASRAGRCRCSGRERGLPLSFYHLSFLYLFLSLFFFSLLTAAISYLSVPPSLPSLLHKDSRVGVKRPPPPPDSGNRRAEGKLTQRAVCHGSAFPPLKELAVFFACNVQRGRSPCKIRQGRVALCTPPSPPPRLSAVEAYCWPPVSLAIFWKDTSALTLHPPTEHIYAMLTSTVFLFQFYLTYSSCFCQSDRRAQWRCSFGTVWCRLKAVQLC